MEQIEKDYKEMGMTMRDLKFRTMTNELRSTTKSTGHKQPYSNN